MGVTRLKRKGRRNKQRSADRITKIKFLTSTPVLKNVDKEELKASFVTEEPIKETKVKTAKEAPKAEVVESPAQEEVEAETPAKEEAKEKAPAKKKAKAVKKEDSSEEAKSAE